MNDWNPRSDGRRTVFHLVNTLCGGGTERMLGTLLNRFDHDRIRHVVVTLREAGDGAASLPNEVACCALNLRGQSRLGFIRLARLVRRWKAEIVHARNTGCWWDAALASLVTAHAQAVLGFHGMDRLNWMDKRLGRFARWIERRGALFTSVSSHGAELLHNQLGLPRARISILRNGVDTSRFQPVRDDTREIARRSLNLPTDAIVVGSAGSLSAIKRLDLLIDAFVRIRAGKPQAHLLLIGDGTMREALGRYARDAGVSDRVHLPGLRSDMAQLFAALDVYVCSSDFEGVSNALLEAMASGLPVISTDVGDHPQIVGNGRTGFIVPRGNVRELSDALTSLIVDPAKRCTLGDSARMRTQDFTIDECVARYERFYESLLRPQTAGFPNAWSDTSHLGVSPQAV